MASKSFFFYGQVFSEILIATNELALYSSLGYSRPCWFGFTGLGINHLANPI